VNPEETLEEDQLVFADVNVDGMEVSCKEESRVNENSLKEKNNTLFINCAINTIK